MIEWANVRAAAGRTGRRTLHESLVDRIGLMIQDGELQAGERLSEAGLCARFEVSRTPLREALKVLASEGYLDWPANRGITVAEIRVDEVRATFELLGSIEGLIGELAGVRVGAEAMHELETMHANMVRLHAEGARNAYFRLNQQIHGLLARMTGNPVLEDVYGSLLRRVHRARALSNTGRVRWSESLQEHETIMAMLRRRDGPGLAACLVAHSKATELIILSEVERLSHRQTE